MRSKAYQALLWAVLVALVGLLVHGLLKTGVFEQQIWHPVGLRRLLRFSAGFSVFVVLLGFTARRLIVPVFAAIAVVFTALEVGPMPVVAVLLFLFSSYALGRLLFPSEKLLALLLGIAVWQFVVALAVRVPINYPAVYLIALAIPLLMRPRLAQECLLLLKPRSWLLKEYLALSLVLFFATVYLLAALMPEVSADGLAMHLAIPGFVANHHYWHFDVARSTWAVMPMAGNWSFTITYMLGGEYAAHLTNYALWMIVAALFYNTVYGWLPRAVSLLLTAALMSAPTAHLVTGSLMIENFLTAMLFGSLLALDRYRNSGRPAYFLLGCTLAGTALATKFGAMALLIPWTTTAVVLAWRRRIGIRYAIAAALFLALLAAPPYVTAYLKTGNPIFPFQNHVFRSPHFETTGPFADIRFRMPLKWDTLYDLTFYTDRYMESQRGSFGYHYLLFVPLCFLLYPARWPWIAKISLAAALVAVWFITRVQFNLRYLYPALPWIMLAVAASWAAVCQSHRRLFFRALITTCVAAVVLNAACLAASNWYHKDFCMTPFKPQRRNAYIESAVPGRKLVEYMNRRHKGEPVLFIGETTVAELYGRAYLDSWHNYWFSVAIQEGGRKEIALAVLRRYGIRFLIVPVNEAIYQPWEQHIRELVNTETVEEQRVGGYRLMRLPG